MFARMLPVFVLVTWVGFAGAQDKKNSDELSVKAKGLVEKHLVDLKAHSPKLRVIEEKYVREIFPNHTFVAVHFAIWPITIPTPEPLKSQNLYAVSKEGKLTHLPDSAKLQKFFEATVGQKPNQSNTVRTWMRLRTEYVQDGYYEFKQPSDIRTILQTISGNNWVAGLVEVVPKAGNKGQLRSTLHFDFQTGDFLGVFDHDEVIRGKRPRAKVGER